MGRFSLAVLQLILAAVVGYAAGRMAQPADAPDVPPVAVAPRPSVVAPPEKPAPPPNPTASTAAALSVSYRSAVERAAPSVVTVHSARTVARGPLGLGGRRVLSQGLGSGVVIDATGFIVTNNHVVADANELAVALPDGSIQPARVVGVDPDSDLALLKVNAANLKPITVGDIKSIAVGDVVLAVGNPLGVGQTVTQGIVSALGRRGIGINPVENFIQTDAAINPGNSGGALIDTAGRLVGINSAILSRGGGSEGIGFAIPVDLTEKVVASLQKTGRVSRGWLGVSTESAPSGDRGATIVAVQPGGPADKAGIVPGDVIVSLGGQAIEQPGDLASTILQLDAGSRVPVEIVRNGKRATIDVELGRRPPLRRPGQPG